MCLTFLLQVGDLVRHDVVKGVVAALQGLLVGETRLLEQVDDHVGSRQLTRGVEVDTDELSKPINEQCQSCWEISNISSYHFSKAPGRVVIPHGLGIAPSFQYWISLNDLVFQACFTFLLLTRGTNAGEI